MKSHFFVLFQVKSRKTFVHLWNTNEDIFDEIQELHKQQQNYHIQGPENY